MGDNFYTPYVDAVTKFRAVDMNVPLAELDKVAGYHHNLWVHCDGEITYNKSTGVLAWSSVLRIIFIRADGDTCTNKVTAGSVTLTDGQFAYVDLSETNDATLTVSAATVSADSASNFITFNRLVLAYRNTASDCCFSVAIKPKIGYDAFTAFTADDATPSVKGRQNWKTANANPTTITMFDDGIDGQVVRVVINDANTTVDFTGGNLKGNAGADWSPASGDWLEAVFDGTDWYCSVHDCTA